ncbi:LCP family protein [Streptomyces sp. NRRL F-5126]|uniref:LCP family protein n=1 Tax=Streptomyces sp. NRRL F-5126 TaxID=1463857 RepID=UPI0004C4AB85|nr:LCP family protein [Streptomyces sp. NRRL F-5126]
MSEWPEGWNGERPERYGRGSASAEPEGARAMPHVQRGSVPPRQRGRYGIPPQQAPGGYGDQYGQGDPYGQGYDSGYNTGQVYGGGRGGGPGDGYGGGPYGPGGTSAPPRRPANWGRRIRYGVLALVVVVLGVSVGTYFWADSKLHKDVDLSKVIDRPAGGAGTNYLIVGSDSRKGMTKEQEKNLHTGAAEGQRTDSMMILHEGAGGPALISLPRDTDITLPSFKGNESGKMYPARPGVHMKLNAAYATDGPTLLVRTIEAKTGLRIDHYVEIGFSGFANVVDAIGGVHMNLDHGFKDKYSGADFKAGEQTLNGKQALEYVRTRHAFATSDLQREKNQQKFLSALASQTATPSTILNPFKLYPALGAGLDTLTVDKDMSPYALAKMFFAMKDVTGGNGVSMTMPVSGNRGGNLVWDQAKVKELVNELNNGQKVTVTG